LNPGPVALQRRLLRV